MNQFGVTAEQYAQRVYQFYQQHNPTKLSEVPQLMEKYRGKEAELIQKLEMKYGGGNMVSPPTQGQGLGQGMGQGQGLGFQQQSVFGVGTSPFGQPTTAVSPFGQQQQPQGIGGFGQQQQQQQQGLGMNTGGFRSGGGWGGGGGLSINTNLGNGTASPNPTPFGGGQGLGFGGGGGGGGGQGLFGNAPSGGHTTTPSFGNTTTLGGGFQRRM